MHIPDGYISPATAVTMYVAATPFWWRATHKAELLLGRALPATVLLSAFSFVIMMFNIPLPGGTTGHAVGAALATLIVGPWAAVLAVSVALVIQALFFGDGGILALGANVFNMAIAMPFVAYWVYRLLAGQGSRRQSLIAAGVAGYVAINVSALLTAVELGIQPLLYKDAAGNALYFPYGLAVAIPAMMIGHLTIGGFAEGFVTALALAWVARSRPELLELGEAQRSPAPIWAWLVLVALVVVTPLGLLAPGTAWGEWGRAELGQLGLGYIPAGFDRWSALWTAPFPGYVVAGIGNPALAYILTAVLGLVLVSLALFVLAHIVRWISHQRSARA